MWAMDGPARRCCTTESTSPQVLHHRLGQGLNSAGSGHVHTETGVKPSLISVRVATVGLTLAGTGVFSVL
ncbi:hypothetical protein [Arthrobacter sp. A2-55]|uniref:hypothetical protein n=1 Tax=Arthrobacter sp. A2-55 TaxID=2897337 RepID=UPI0021CD92BF|nr:hypothetical protein [Arthrobacter sp. A2-55]MCU6482633.1 hypothetical protein [Arthrobacter sp. A2-55]